MHDPTDATAVEWAVALFQRSVLKQEKYRQLTALLGDVRGMRCLDIGADNGVISYLLRQRGGEWCSADLDERTVDSIRQLVGSDVFRITGNRTPFGDGSFDRVVIVDFLEHIHTDEEFARELHRILKPGGRLIVNVPHIKPGSILNRVRHAIGLTDEKHGHVRPGYTVAGLERTLGTGFRVDASRTYSRTFSEAIDTLLNAAYQLRGRGREGNAGSSAKGTVITGADWKRYRKEFRVLRLLYPMLWLTAKLDRLLFLQEGYKLIVRATAEPTAAVVAASAPRGDARTQGY